MYTEVDKTVRSVTAYCFHHPEKCFVRYAVIVTCIFKHNFCEQETVLFLFGNPC